MRIYYTRDKREMDLALRHTRERAFALCIRYTRGKREMENPLQVTP